MTKIKKFRNKLSWSGFHFPEKHRKGWQWWHLTFYFNSFNRDKVFKSRAKDFPSLKV